MTFQSGKSRRAHGDALRAIASDSGLHAVACGGVALALVDVNWRIVTANRPWTERAAATGLQAHLEPGRNYAAFYHKFSAEGGIRQPHLLELSRHANARLVNVRHMVRLPDGSRAEIVVEPLDIGGSRYAILILMDRDEIADAQIAHLLPDEDMQEARTLLIRVLGEERRSVARDLHDSAGQYLTALSLALTRMRQIECNPTMAELIAEMGGLLDDFHQRIRAITYVLHPPELEDAGLCAALKSLCEGLARRTTLEIGLRVHGAALARKDKVEAIAYQIIQEGLTNVVRHASGTMVQVRLCLRARTVLLVVRDDGVGLAGQRQAAGGNLELGVGIAGITARVRKLGGRFVWRDARGQSGTFLAAVFPRDRNGSPPLRAVLPALIDRLAG